MQPSELLPTAARIEAELPARLERSTGRAVDRLRSLHQLVPDAQLQTRLPWAMGRWLSWVIAAAETNGKDQTVANHYFETMPRLRVEQLVSLAEPNRTLFHTPLNWSLLPRLSGAIDRLFELLGRDAKAAIGSTSAASFRSDRPTLNLLFQSTYYGGFMPLLYAYPADLAAIGQRLEGGLPLMAAIDRHLAAPLVHELSHFGPNRRAIFPPYLDECIPAFLGTLLLKGTVWPEEHENDALFGGPWLVQVGQALARTIGLGPLVRAHAGLVQWDTVLPSSLAERLLELGWEEHSAHGSIHFLTSRQRPEPWMKLFFLAASGVALESWTLDRLDLLPWCDIPPGNEAPEDMAILENALRTMCLFNQRTEGTFRVVPCAPNSLVTIDLDRCQVGVQCTAGACDEASIRYLFPPALAVRLRAAGVAGFRMEISNLDAIAEMVQQIAAGKGGSGSGYRIDVIS